MGQFGQELRRERESRGIALESITGVTKISGRHLLALEESNFGALPGGVLSKGIVRGYVRAVGLDEEAWMSRFLAATQPAEPLASEDTGWIEFAENVSRSRKPDERRPVQGMRWAGVALLLTLLALFSWYVAHFVTVRAMLGPAPAQPRVQARGSALPGVVLPASVACRF